MLLYYGLVNFKWFEVYSLMEICDVTGVVCLSFLFYLIF